MSKGEEHVKACEMCGASIYPEHIKKHTADHWMGKLLCGHCLKERRAIAAVNPAAAYADTLAKAEPEPLTIALDDDTEPATEKSSTQIRAVGGGGRSGGTTFGAPFVEGRYKRSLEPNSPRATRCRTFHCKLTDSSLAHLNDMINEWVDSHDGIQLKFATNCIGVMEGKSSSDPNLFVTVFY